MLALARTGLSPRLFARHLCGIPLTRSKSRIRYGRAAEASSSDDIDSLLHELDQLLDGRRGHTLNEALLAVGINWATDQRLAPIHARFSDAEDVRVTRSFSRRGHAPTRSPPPPLDAESLLLTLRALRGELVVDEWASVTSEVAAIHDEVAEAVPTTEGKLADYIPQLALADPTLWGTSLCTIDGQRFAAGDTDVPVCLQSCSKPFLYGMSLEEHGAELVHNSFIGREPSGAAFNELVLDKLGRPHNPLINSGAIMAASLVFDGMSPELRFDRACDVLSAAAGGERVGFANSIFMSEKAVASRNKALAFVMQDRGSFRGVGEARTWGGDAALNETLDLYFQLCASEMTVEQAAVAASTLANGGVCPLTSRRIFSDANTRDVLCAMSSCGMYDYSGAWSNIIGVPAKSGVSGLILVVIPGVAGFATLAPPIDASGNSSRGLEFFRRLADRFRLHHLERTMPTKGKLPFSIDDRRTLGGAASTAARPVSDLVWAASIGDVGRIRHILASGLDVDVADYDNRTALHLAAANGHLAAARTLIAHGADPSIEDRWGATAVDGVFETDDAMRAVLRGGHIVTAAAASDESASG